MESEKQLNIEIIELTQRIRDQYPELEKYMEELQLSIPDQTQFSKDSLREYRDTLRSMILKYSKK